MRVFCRSITPKLKVVLCVTSISIPLNQEFVIAINALGRAMDKQIAATFVERSESLGNYVSEVTISLNITVFSPYCRGLR